MELEFYQMILIALVMLGASLIQSVTGFGFGIFAMAFLPHLMAYTEANVLSTILSTFTSLAVVALMLKHVDWKNMISPAVGCTVSTYLAVSFIKTQESGTLTLMLGVALVVLSVYFFFFAGKIRIRATWYTGLAAGLLSGVMGGMFSMSGPPAVIYFMQSESGTDKYLATVSAYFVLTNIFSIATKAAAGFVTLNVCFALAVGAVGMILGSIGGKLTRDKMRPTALKRAVYAVMAVSGVVNIVTSLM